MIVVATPPPAPVESLSQSVTVMLTPTQKAQVATSAAKEGVSMSAYVRRLLEREAANG